MAMLLKANNSRQGLKITEKVECAMPEFLDKVKEGIDKGVTVVSVRSKEMLEAAKIKAKIGSLAEKKKDTLEELGSLAHAMHRQGGLNLGPDVAAKCGEIDALATQIQEKEAELKKIHLDAKKELGIALCASCGEGLEESDKFCGKCGAKAGDIL
jgi:NADH pyrophosphatase NudC (nudix superfamily)